MKRILTLTFFCTCIIGMALGSADKAQKAKKGWQPLFAADLSNADYPAGIWTVEDGVMCATEDREIWTKTEYENFELDLEFKTDVGTNSGVIVYCTNKRNWIPNSVEIQIADDHGDKWGTSPTHMQCAAIFGHLPANKQKVVKKPGEWNRMLISCKGKIITIKLNGKKVTEMDMNLWTSGKVNPDGSEIPSWLPTPFSELPTKGFIGLQGKHGDALIWFRNVKVKEL